MIFIKKNQSGWSFISQNNFQARGESTIKMILDAIIEHKGPISTSDIIINTDDYPSKMEKDNFYYCCEDVSQLKNVIPDYTFSSWPEAGINSFINISNQIIQAGKKPFLYDKIFWIGNVATNKNREILYALSRQYREFFEVYHTSVDQYILNKEKVPYVSLPLHCKFKYLIDIEGRGYSGRLKFLLFSKRLLFIQERRYKEFFHFNLIPYIHFIPIKNDLSDLIDKYIEIRNDEALYEKITTNALNFATKNLNYTAVIKHMSKVLFNNNSEALPQKGKRH